MCIDRNAYLASFPFGQCMDWTTHADQCPEATVENITNVATDNVCLGYQTCDSCRSNPSCGWCDNGAGTGIGACHIGGASGPLTKNRPGHSHVQWVLSDTCPVEGMDCKYIQITDLSRLIYNFHFAKVMVSNTLTLSTVGFWSKIKNSGPDQNDQNCRF